MVKISAGILVYRLENNRVEVFLVHPGGPYFTKKDKGAWTIPKGELNEQEDPFIAARRELFEETGYMHEGNFIPLTAIKQKAGKIVMAWAVKGDIDIKTLSCNKFSIEWPPRSGKMKEFPEVDKGEWFAIDMAKEKINPAQIAFIDDLIDYLKRPDPDKTMS